MKSTKYILIGILVSVSVTYSNLTQSVEWQNGSSGTDEQKEESLRNDIAWWNQRIDTIFITLSRVSDRMVAIETKLNQQSERIDNVNYKLTKLELFGEERKSELAEVSNVLRHRTQTSESVLERFHDILENLKDDIRHVKLDTNHIKFNQNIGQNCNNGQKIERIHSLGVGILNIKAQLHSLQRMTRNIEKNVTNFGHIKRNTDDIRENLMRKEEMHLMMSDLKANIIAKMPIKGQSTNMKSKDIATDCWELQMEKGHKDSGIYKVWPSLAPNPFFVYCEMSIEGGGWTVIQHRHDGSVNFLRNWLDYKHGFGNLAGEFWLGNEKISQITNENVNELRISLWDFSHKEKTANYSAFAIGSETEAYALKLLGQYSGNAGDSLIFHVGQKWSTIDMDNDAFPERSCARDHQGAWWYKSCEKSNLNGQYLHGSVPQSNEYQGMYWYDFHGPQYSLWKSTMAIKRSRGVVKPLPQEITLPIYNEK